MRTTRYVPNQYPWNSGRPLVDLGIDVPRLNLENQGACPRTWPAQYMWHLMGLGAMPLFQLGATAPTVNNSLSPYSPAMNLLMPGLAKLPYGG